MKYTGNSIFSSIQFSHSVESQLFVTPWTATYQVSLSITNSQSLLKHTSIELVLPSNHLILCHPLLLLPSIFPRSKVFSDESVLRIRWSKYWSFSISPSKEYLGLTSFRKVKVAQLCPTLCDTMDYTAHGILQATILEWVSVPFSRVSSQPRGWIQGSQVSGIPCRFFTSWATREAQSFKIDWFDLLAVQGTIKSLLQHHSLKASILQCSAFFMVQLSHLYMATGKTIALTTKVSKVMFLLFNTLSRFVIAFLPRSKHLLISPAAVILEPEKKKICHCFHFFPIYLPWSDGTRCHNLSFMNVKL